MGRVPAIALSLVVLLWPAAVNAVSKEKAWPDFEHGHWKTTTFVAAAMRSLGAELALQVP